MTAAATISHSYRASSSPVRDRDQGRRVYGWVCTLTPGDTSVGGGEFASPRKIIWGPPSLKTGVQACFLEKKKSPTQNYGTTQKVT